MLPFKGVCVCACASGIADKTSWSISSLPCHFSFPAAPASHGVLSEQDEMAEREGDACSGHLHHGISDGEMWLPAPSPSQGDASQAQGVKAITSICQAKPLCSCSWASHLHEREPPCNWGRQHQHWSKSLGSGLQHWAILGAIYCSGFAFNCFHSLLWALCVAFNLALLFRASFA